MNLDAYQVGYFVSQVGLAESSFGVSTADISSVATALSGAFNAKCAPATEIDQEQGPQLQSICVADSCQKAPKGDCGPYGTSAGEPLIANATLALGEGRNGTDSNGTTTKATGNTGTTTGLKPTKTGKSSSFGTLLEANIWLVVLIGTVTVFKLKL